MPRVSDTAVHAPSALLKMRAEMPGILWPPISAGAVAVLGCLLYQFEESQWLTPEKIAEEQARQLAVLAEHFWQRSPRFRSRLERAGLRPADLCTRAGFVRLPPLVRRDIQSAGPDFFCAPPDGHAPVSDNFSSGSTGEPVMVKRTAVNQLYWLGLTVRDHLWWKRDVSSRQAIIRKQSDGYSERPDWGTPMSLLFDTGPTARIPLTTPIAEQVRLLEAFRPDTILLHPTNLAGLTDHCRRHDVSLASLRGLRTFGEMLSPHVRDDAEVFFGVPIDDCYSSQEVGYIAQQCGESALYHVAAESLMVEVVNDSGQPCGEGEAGRILVTDIHNFATPLIRYEIGDWAVPGQPCPCGRGLPTLTRVLGRQRNLIVMPDGTRHWPLSGFQKVRAVAPIRQSQFIQHTREKIEVRLVVDRPLTAGEESDLRALIQTILGYPFDLDIRYFDDGLPPGSGGKFEQFISRAV